MGQKVMAYLHSKKVGELQGEKEEVEILETRDYYGTTQYIARTQSGIKCTAIFNGFINAYFAADIYGVIED